MENLTVAHSGFSREKRRRNQLLAGYPSFNRLETCLNEVESMLNEFKSVQT